MNNQTNDLHISTHLPENAGTSADATQSFTRNLISLFLVLVFAISNVWLYFGNFVNQAQTNSLDPDHFLTPLTGPSPFPHYFSGLLLAIGIFLTFGFWVKDRHFGKCVLIGSLLAIVFSYPAHRLFYASLTTPGWWHILFTARPIMMVLLFAMAALFLLAIWLWTSAPTPFHGIAGGIIVGSIPALLLGGPIVSFLTAHPGVLETIYKPRPTLADMFFHLPKTFGLFAILSLLVTAIPLLTGFLGGLRSTSAPARTDPLFVDAHPLLPSLILVIFVLFNSITSVIVTASFASSISSLNSIMDNSLTVSCIPNNLSFALFLFPFAFFNLAATAILLTRNWYYKPSELTSSIVAGVLVILNGLFWYTLAPAMKMLALFQIVMGGLVFVQSLIKRLAAQDVPTQWPTAGLFSQMLFHTTFLLIFALGPIINLFLAWALEIGLSWVVLIAYLTLEKGGKSPTELIQQISGVSGVFGVSNTFVGVFVVAMVIIGVVTWLAYSAIFWLMHHRQKMALATPPA